MGNVPSTSTESITDDQLLKLLDNQATLAGPSLTPYNNKFLRSLRCRRAGESDSTVVKAFFVKNLDLSPFREKLKIQKMLLTSESAPNVLAYQRFREGGGPIPAFVARQYLFANLKDRLSTRPFLSDAEKLWIAFGLINAGAQLHRAGLGHGDIKSENVMLTSWGWPVLTDLAPFKPTFMQADQSAAPFNFFFSTGKKRCYLAPERFVVTGMSASSGKTSSKEALKRRFQEVMGSRDAGAKKGAEVLADFAGVGRSSKDAKDAQMAQTVLLENRSGKKGVPADMDVSGWRRDVNDDLLPSMDVFSIGCVLAELFNADAEATFELSDTLHYASRGESPRLASLLTKIVDPSMRAMVHSMTKHDPACRLRLEDYLEIYTPQVFPDCFREVLYPFMKGFLTESNVEDALVWRTCQRYGELVKNLMGIEDVEGTNLFQGLFKAKSERESLLILSSRRSKISSTTTPPPPSSSNNGHPTSSRSVSPPAIPPVPSSSSLSDNPTPQPQQQQSDADDVHFKEVEDLIHDLEQKLSAAMKSSAILAPGHSTTSNSKRKSSVNETEETSPSEQTAAMTATSPSFIIVVISYLCISAQYASKAGTRVMALLLMKRMCILEDDADLILSRVLPFFMDRLQDHSAWVRCTTLQAMTELLEVVDAVPPSESKVFPDYLIPSLSECARDVSESVRVTFASCLPSIATSAKKFLELARAQQQLAVGAALAASSVTATSTSPTTVTPSALPSYDAELGLLHDAVQKMIDRTVATEHSHLVTGALGNTGGIGNNADIAVKAALISRVMQLCLFFGRDRIDRWLLLWLLSVVNTRGSGNWRLQVAVLNSLASIGAFVGDEAFDQYLYPLIDDMLTNGSQELVVEAAAHCLTSLVSLGLLKTGEMFKLVKKVAPMTRHPSSRLRKAAVLLLAAISSQHRLVPHVDVQLFVAEKLRAFFSPKNNNEAEKFILLLGKSGQSLETNALLLEQCLHLDPCPSISDWTAEFVAAPPPKKLSSATSSSSVTSPMPLQHQQAHVIPAGAKTGYSSNSHHVGAGTMMHMSRMETPRQVRVHLLRTDETHGMSLPNNNSLLTSASVKAICSRYGIVMSENEYVTGRVLLKRAIALGLPETRLSLGRLRMMENYYSAPAMTARGSSSAGHSSGQQGIETQSQRPHASTASAGGASSPHLSHGQQHPSSPYINISHHNQGVMMVQSTPPVDWKPRGLLVSSLHEHSGPVNRVTCSDDFSFFATASDDGTCKVWKTDKLDRNPCPRSRVTFEMNHSNNNSGGSRNGSTGVSGCRVIDVCSIRNTTSIAVAADTGQVSIVRVDSTSAQAESQRNLKSDATRLVAIGCGSTNDLFACTERGSVLHWDLRSAHRKHQVEGMCLVLGLGSVSCMTISPDRTWIAVGTHRGVVAVFDLRFNLLIAAWRHPCSCAIHRLYCPKVTEGVLPLVFVSAGPNQVALLNLETGEVKSALTCALSEVSADKNKLAEWKLSQEQFFAKPYERIDLNARQVDRYVQEAKFASSNSSLYPFATSPHHSVRAILCPSDVFSSSPSSVNWAGAGGGGGYEPPSVLTAGTDMVVRYWDLQHHASNSSVITAPQDEPKIKWETKDIANRPDQKLFFSLSGQRQSSSSSSASSASSSKSKTKFLVRPAHSDAILDMAGLRMPVDSSAHIITCGRDAVVRVWK